MRNYSEPPKRLSDLVELAIKDARGLDPDIYEPAESYWHRPSSDGLCRICLAGAVLAGTLGYSPDLDIDPQKIGDDRWERALIALEELRTGFWRTAWGVFHTENPHNAKLLISLPPPTPRDFSNWQQMEEHLRSLEVILPRLRAFEKEYV